MKRELAVAASAASPLVITPSGNFSDGKGRERGELVVVENGHSAMSSHVKHRFGFQILTHNVNKRKGSTKFYTLKSYFVPPLYFRYQELYLKKFFCHIFVFSGKNIM